MEIGPGGAAGALAAQCKQVTERENQCLSPQAATGTLTIDMLFHGSQSSPKQAHDSEVWMRDCRQTHS